MGNSPDDLLLRLQLPLHARVLASVAADHGFPIVVQPEAHRSVKNSAQFLQKSCAGAEKLLWRQ